MTHLHRIFFLFLILGQTCAFAKRVTLSWREISGAEKYELELYKGESNTPIKATSLKMTLWKKDLEPGWYFFKVRGIDVDEQPGEWSKAISVFVPTEKPEFILPKTESVWEEENNPATINFQWKKTNGASFYSLEVKQGEKVVFTQETEATQLDWELPEGEYTAFLQANVRGVSSPLSENETSPWKSEKVQAHFTVAHKKEEAREVAAVPSVSESVAPLNDLSYKPTLLTFLAGTQQWSYESNEVPKASALAPVFSLGVEKGLTKKVSLFGEGGVASYAVTGLETKNQKNVAVGASYRVWEKESSLWNVNFDLAMQYTDFFEITPLSSQGTMLRTQLTSFSMAGMKARAVISKQVANKAKLLLTIVGNFPFLNLTSNAGRLLRSVRTLGASTAGVYEINPRFDLGVKGFWETGTMTTEGSSDSPAQNITLQSIGALLFTGIRF